MGDSAHTMPPFKGGRANSAIESAHNQAWKLATVLNGAAAPELPDSYHAERHPVGRFAARQSLTGPAMTFLPLEDDRHLFREMILRRSFDEIAEINGWEFHIDGIHVNTRAAAS
jgi:2-polyprenyl-6-methoxyphenol hydroxylase-like FAD-dependent oxidoreductase